MKKALITGITGQDGTYLTEQLLEKGYEVHGIIRPASTFTTERIDHLYRDPHMKDVRMLLHHGDMNDANNLNRLLEKIEPDEIYNLAAQSNVKISFEVPEYTVEVNALGTLRLLDAIKDVSIKTRLCQASTSECYGKVAAPVQNEETPFYPRSPYGVSKLCSHWLTVNYREAYGIFACNGIFFNHESPRRGKRFVSRKITRAISRIKKGLEEKLYLGNLDARRDWGYAPDYTRAMWLMLQQDKPDDYVIATGENHTVREFAELAFSMAGFRLEWAGEGLDEKGMDAATGKVLIEVDPKYFRPTEVDELCGNAGKAREKLSWKPTVPFEELVRIMVEHDLEHTEETEGS